MKTALEALEMLAKWEHPASNITTKSGRIYPHHVAKNAAATLRLAIEEAEKQEPLFLLYTGEIDGSGEQDDWDIEADSGKRVDEFCADNPSQTVPLFAAPAQRQPLTDEAGLLEQNTELDKKLAELERVNAQLLTALQQIIDLPEDSRIHYKVARRAIAAAKEKS